VRIGLEGNLCRCTGYHNIVRAGARLCGDERGRVAGETLGSVTVIPTQFEYVRAGSAGGGDQPHRRARGGREDDRRRPQPAPDVKLRLAQPSVADSTSAGSRPVVRPATRRPHRGSAQLTRHMDVEEEPGARRATSRSSPCGEPRRAIRRSVTAARSAARSRTATRRAERRRRRWRSERPTSHRGRTARGRSRQRNSTRAS
jgi:hypothetical protein